MKTAIPFLFTLFIFSCANAPKTENPPRSFPTSLQGEWILSEYIDSIYQNKKVAKYRGLRAAQGAILLDIEEDTIHTFGSVYHHSKYPIQLKGDTFAITENMNCKLFLKDSTQVKINCEDGVFHYKRPDRWADKVLVHSSPERIKKKLPEVIQVYANSFLFNKKYKDIKSGKTVEFAFPRHMKGLNKWTHFRVNTFQGTLHPINHDWVEFRNKNESKIYGFETSGDTVKLKHMNTNDDKWFLEKNKEDIVLVRESNSK